MPLSDSSTVSTRIW